MTTITGRRPSGPGRSVDHMILSRGVPLLLLLSACLGVSGCSIGCTAVGAASGVQVLVTGDAAVAEEDTQMDVTTCVRGHCPATSQDLAAGERPNFFVEAPWVDSERPVEVQVTVHEGRRVVAGPVTLTVTPEVVQPNGPRCDPTEYVATVEVAAHP